MNRESEPISHGLPVSQEYAALNVWIGGSGPEDGDAAHSDVPVAREDLARRHAAWKHAISELDSLLIELGDGAEPVVSIRDKIRRIRLLLAEGRPPTEIE